MLFEGAQATVRPAIIWKSSGAVNAFLGSVCKSLSRKEQKKYYQATAKERLRHQQQYPGLSNNDNYVRQNADKSRKEKTQEVMEDAEKVSSKSESEETPPSKWMMLMPKYGDKFNNYYNRPHETECRCQMKLRSRKRPNFG
ncbi:hypothetical protein D4764_12G0006790 [Takifugu flavidus]|uniref:HMG box domain-containing protein n=1 Tax=Takifugu flavidus TaxID=433684 RepID=A0A5C6PE57_9TELE|nr:hypothetical protein D4764_12G0006790 [Takifugu flavidus]